MHLPWTDIQRRTVAAGEHLGEAATRTLLGATIATADATACARAWNEVVDATPFARAVAGASGLTIDPAGSAPSARRLVRARFRSSPEGTRVVVDADGTVLDRRSARQLLAAVVAATDGSTPAGEDDRVALDAVLAASAPYEGTRRTPTDAPLLELPYDARPASGCDWRAGAIRIDATSPFAVAAVGAAEAVGVDTGVAVLAALDAALAWYGNERRTVALDVDLRGPAAGRVVGPLAALLPAHTNHDVRAEGRDGHVDRIVESVRALAARRGDAWAAVAAHTSGIVDPHRQIAVAAVEAVPGARLWVPPRRRVRAPLEFELVVGNGRLDGVLLYSRTCFALGGARRFLQHLEAALRAIAGGADWNARSLLADGERRRLRRFERQGGTEPVDRTVPERVAHWTSATPEAIAVVDGDAELSYTELDRASGALAAELAAAAAGQPIVALMLPPGASAVIAQLAIWKAGAAYLPIDPEQPIVRTAAILRDAGATLVVTDEPGRAALSDCAGVTPMSVKRAFGDAAVPAPPPPALPPSPQAPAYVIYTSGSTGDPKGVAVSHRSLANLVQWHRGAYGVRPGDRATVQASPGFDAAVWEEWPYLASGATLVIVPRALRADVDALVDWWRSAGITVTFLPTPLAEALLQRDADTGSVRFVLTGGEALRGRPPATASYRLVNHYGPTEVTVLATAGEVEPGGQGHPPAIGRPISNAFAAVLDEDGNRAPIGVTGGLYVGGSGVAIGYVGRGRDGDHRFAPARSIAKDSAPSFVDRLYDTGDRARWTADGELVFAGRRDGQMKIRGHRVEPGEIEAALAAHPDVRDGCVTVVGGDDAGSLVAHVVPKAPIDRHELRAFLAARLPKYMLPARIVSHETLPLIASGKIDRVALSTCSVAATAADDHEPTVGTLDRAESDVALMFERLLGVAFAGVWDDFFDLGGDSVLALRLAREFEVTFGRRLSLDELYRDARVAAVAALARRSSAGVPPGAITSMRLGAPEADGRVVLLPSERDMRYVRRAVADAGPGVGVTVLAPPVTLGPAGLDRQAIVEAYAAEATRAAGNRPVELVGYCLAGVDALAVASALQARGHQVASVRLVDTDPLPPLVAMPTRTVVFLADGPLGHAALDAALDDIDAMRRSKPPAAEIVKALREVLHKHRAAVCDYYAADGAQRSPEEIHSYVDAWAAYAAATIHEPPQSVTADAVLLCSCGAGGSFSAAGVRDAAAYWRQRVGSLDVVEVPTAHGMLMRDPIVVTTSTATSLRSSDG